MKKIFTVIVITIVACRVPAAAQQPAATGPDAASREAFIQKALQLRQAEDYNGAVQQLDSILALNPADAPALLFKGDLLLQAKRFADAAAAYRQLLPLRFEPALAQINLSYALFMNHQPARALLAAHTAFTQHPASTAAIVNYFNALLWNVKTREAGRFLQQHRHLLPPAQQLVLQARLHTTSGHYTGGLQLYDSLVRSHPDKYYVQEYAEVLLGKKQLAASAGLVNKHSALFSAGEYRALQQKLAAAAQQQAGTTFVYFKDVAQNVRLENSTWWQQSDGRKYRLRLSAGTSAITSAQQATAKTRFGQIQVAERWSPAWSGETTLHLQWIQPGNGHRFTGLTGRQVIQYQPNDRRMAGLFYSTDILNFTAPLLGSNIRGHNAGYITHLMLGGKTGFYSQGSAGRLSDANRRYQVFASIYRLLRTEPTLKTGMNASALHFTNSSIKTYFSPGRYLNAEVFADYSTALPHLSKWYLQLQGAAGLQQIERQPWQTALRLQAELGLRLRRLDAGLQYQTSNVAGNNGTGYGFHWVTVRAAWRW